MFSPSNNQVRAIINMENFLGFQEYRDSFETNKEFQDYFEMLMKQISWIEKIREKKKKMINLPSKVKKDIQEKKNKKIEKYYQNFDNLKRKALTYYFWYSVSKKKLESYLLKKCWWNEELVSEVLESLNSVIDDKKIIDGTISFYLKSWKNRDYIRNKLYQKQFKYDDFKEALEQAISNVSWSVLVGKIKMFQRKWKPKKSIYFELCKYSNDTDLIKEILDENFDEGIEEEKLKNEINKLKKRNYDQNKIIQNCMRKWFEYEVVKRVLN